jgi:hypothetical protein
MFLSDKFSPSYALDARRNACWSSCKAPITARLKNVGTCRKIFGKTSNFIAICAAVLELSHADRQTDAYVCNFYANVPKNAFTALTHPEMLHPPYELLWARRCYWPHAGQVVHLPKLRMKFGPLKNQAHSSSRSTTSALPLLPSLAISFFLPTAPFYVFRYFSNNRYYVSRVNIEVTIII